MKYANGFILLLIMRTIWKIGRCGNMVEFWIGFENDIGPDLDIDLTLTLILVLTKH